MKHVIIFDGTLVDSNATCVDILQAMLEDRGSAHRIDSTASAVYMSLGGERMVSVLPLANTASVRIRILPNSRSLCGLLTPRETLFDGVAKGLNVCLTQDLTWRSAPTSQRTCATAAWRYRHRSPVQRRGRDDAGTETQAGKRPAGRNSAAPWQECRELAFRGDSDLDHLIAEAANMPFCFMTYGYAEPGWVPPGGKSFDRFGELN